MCIWVTAKAYTNKHIYKLLLATAFITQAYKNIVNAFFVCVLLEFCEKKK